MAVAADERGRETPEVHDTDVTTTAINEKTSTVVPAGALGWVRLDWRGEAVGTRFLNADLWMNLRGGSLNALLEVGALIVDPIEVDRDVSAGNLHVRDLEAGKKLWIVCWSATRPSFHLKSQRVQERGVSDSDPIEVGEPMALSDKDLRRVQQSPRRRRCPYYPAIASR